MTSVETAVALVISGFLTAGFLDLLGFWDWLCDRVFH